MKFSKNWNKKLNGEFFTSIRPYAYYFQKVGKLEPIEMNGNLIGHAKIIRIDGPALLSAIPKTVLETDTGYSHEEAANILKKMYSGEDLEKFTFAIICMKWFKRL